MESESVPFHQQMHDREAMQLYTGRRPPTPSQYRGREYVAWWKTIQDVSSSTSVRTREAKSPKTPQGLRRFSCQFPYSRLKSDEKAVKVGLTENGACSSGQADVQAGQFTPIERKVSDAIATPKSRDRTQIALMRAPVMRRRVVVVSPIRRQEFEMDSSEESSESDDEGEDMYADVDVDKITRRTLGYKDDEDDNKPVVDAGGDDRPKIVALQDEEASSTPGKVLSPNSPEVTDSSNVDDSSESGDSSYSDDSSDYDDEGEHTSTDEDKMTRTTPDCRSVDNKDSPVTDAFGDARPKVVLQKENVPFVPT